jgi:hypothetical protein
MYACTTICLHERKIYGAGPSGVRRACRISLFSLRRNVLRWVAKGYNGVEIRGIGTEATKILFLYRENERGQGKRGRKLGEPQKATTQSIEHLACTVQFLSYQNSSVKLSHSTSVMTTKSSLVEQCAGRKEGRLSQLDIAFHSTQSISQAIDLPACLSVCHVCRSLSH